MLAKNQIPQSFLDWNTQHGAPFGHPLILSKKLKRWLPSSWYWKLRGSFSIQRNNTTREFEYPWVYSQLQPSAGMSIVDVGGGLSGFQFVLSGLDCRVVNVDPGLEAAGRGWPCNQKMIAQLNNCFHTNVELQNTTMEQAKFAPGSVDAVISVSVIEHLPWDDVKSVMEQAWTILKPGGKFILTIDLFQDIHPFQSTISNKYGSNINVKSLVEVVPFEVEVGDRSQLFGFKEFDPEKVWSRSDTFLIGKGYPAMVQCLVLVKPLTSPD